MATGSVEDLLRALRLLEGLEGLTALSQALGQEPLFDPIAPGAGLLPEGAGWRAALIGGSADFPWLGVEAESPRDVARAIAARLRSVSRLALVVVVAPGGGALAVSVPAHPPPPPLLELRPRAPEAVGLESLGRLARLPAGGLAAAQRAAQVLGAEAVGRAFFEAFRRVHAAMAASLTGVPRSDRDPLALLQLTRMLFLYFLQSKGWLDGDPEFLRRRVDACLARRRSVHARLLRPLFFGTLNRPADRRGTAARRFGRVPFLNGGLFEPHPLERRHRPSVPNRCWRDALDELFERFEFTVAEGQAGPCIAPEMLGRVFEGLMAEDDRRQTGTFYTPPDLVRAMTEAALRAHLAARLSLTEGEAQGLLEEPDARGAAVLAEIRILDPAVGSGAFLLGALEILVALRQDGRPPAALKREVLARSLFGVDRSAAAVRLTELRLWLAVVADEPDQAPDRVPPLPNLDCLVRQGDSLQDPLLLDLPFAVALPEHGLAALRQRVFAASGPAKAAAVRDLRQAEQSAARERLDATEEAVRRELSVAIADGRSATLFGRRGLDDDLRRQVRALRRRLAQVRSARRRLERDGELPWFQYASQFADVFAERGGFDLVVGNPPWVRAEALAPEVRERLRERYRWWRPGPGRGFRHQPDLAVAFVERAWELAADRGAIGLLVPAKLATASYGTAARAALARRATLSALADLGQGGFSAAVYPMGLVAVKAPPAAESACRLSLRPGGPSIPQRRLAGGGPWILAGDGVAEVLERMRAMPTLDGRFAIHLGVKTGADRVFLEPGDDVEPEVLRRGLRGRDVRAFRVRATTGLLWGYDASGRPLASLPPGADAHCRREAVRLVARSDYAGGPLWTLFRTRPALAPWRVAWADLAPALAAVALVGSLADVIPLNTCYLLAAPDEPTALAMAAWLNSRWIGALASAVALPARGGYARFGARTVGGLPCPDAALEDATLVGLGRTGAEGKDIHRELDAHVARLLDLDREERRALASLVRGPARR